MNKKQFKMMESIMRVQMQNDPEDVAHIHRVLHHAVRIAKTEPKARMDVVVLAALLHDIGRGGLQQRAGPHAELGAEMAWPILLREGWGEETARRVCACIRSHSAKKKPAPKSIEAKILYDADKLDIAGAVGTARMIRLSAEAGEPLYVLDGEGRPVLYSDEGAPALLREYHRRLRRLPKEMHTKKGQKMARKRQKIADAFFETLQQELEADYTQGAQILKNTLKKRG